MFKRWFSVLVLAFCAQALQGVHAADRGISEDGFWPIGGIQQWITIRGQDRGNPVVLVVHGGPGNPLSPYADAMYAGWTKDFTVVHWDQRGAGKTFGRNPATAESTLTLGLMASDGIEVAEFLRRHLNQPKIILMGNSWGSILAVHMAKRRPDLFYAYVGTSQYVSRQANEAASYSQTLALAKQADDKKTVAALEAIGPPPRTNPRAFGVLRRAIRAYEAKVSTPAPPNWWAPASPYATAPALADTEAGEDYSFVQFVGMQGDGMLSHVNLPGMGLRFDVPVYLVQGKEDLLTPIAVTQPYFDNLQAPDKAMVVVPNAGHGPNEAVLAAEFRLLMERVRPVAK
ncbi:MAG: alpha/beta hydrolase [Rhodoferax sp.]|nr:alpha/beta hydrolase [Rhodoferax sp.]